ncbi:Rhamnogalacturonan lyase, domain III [Dillenia turbinata]|uniref:Rhamnogalacturonan lyase, domain III n=1 Tax=Dillenia turbinata TaxID=194707 RepID=A0AAN8UXI1_9MAGN
MFPLLLQIYAFDRPHCLFCLYRYWDTNWSLPGGQGQDRYHLGVNIMSLVQMMIAQRFHSGVLTHTPSTSGVRLPLSIDIRYTQRSGVSGFYCHAIYERPPDCRPFDLAQTRMEFELRQDRFHYMATTDEKQRIMPMPQDLLPGRGKQPITPESVLPVNPINPDPKGKVEYHRTCTLNFKDSKVMQQGTHYIGDDIVAHFEEGETWRKVFGPFFVHLNSTDNVSKAYSLWTDAKQQLHGFVPGFIGNYLDSTPVTIITVQLGDLAFVPPRDGPTVWEIGYPDCTAIGYYVPDVNPKSVNKLIVNSPEKYRQHGLWERYTDLPPAADQAFTIGISDPKKDWFFAHVARSPDNTVCRHGIHGFYKLFSVDISSSWLTNGDNLTYLTQAREGDSLCSILYDYLRLEATATSERTE